MPSPSLLTDFPPSSNDQNSAEIEVLLSQLISTIESRSFSTDSPSIPHQKDTTDEVTEAETTPQSTLLSPPLPSNSSPEQDSEDGDIEFLEIIKTRNPSVPVSAANPLRVSIPSSPSLLAKNSTDDEVEILSEKAPPSQRNLSIESPPLPVKSVLSIPEQISADDKIEISEDDVIFLDDSPLPSDSTPSTPLEMIQITMKEYKRLKHVEELYRQENIRQKDERRDKLALEGIIFDKSTKEWRDVEELENRIDWLVYEIAHARDEYREINTALNRIAESSSPNVNGMDIDYYLNRESKEIAAEEHLSKTKELLVKLLDTCSQANANPHTQRIKYTRKCNDCQAPNPLVRAVMTSCGHIFCIGCAEEMNGARDDSYMCCPSCEERTGFVRIVEEVEHGDTFLDSRKRPHTNEYSHMPSHKRTR